MSGACELTSSAYREAWYGTGIDGYTTNDTRLAYAGFMRHSDGQVVYCYGTTKYACEGGFATAPFTEDYDWFETSTQICGLDVGINECYADSESCTIANCHVELTATLDDIDVDF